MRFLFFLLVTARKRSLRRLCFYTCLSVRPQGVWGWVVSQHALQVSRRCIPACLAGFQEVYPSMPCRSPGGVSQHALQVSRPTPKGGARGVWPRGGLQAHTQVSIQAHTGGLKAHTWRGVSQHALRQTPQLTATAVGGTHPT